MCGIAGVFGKCEDTKLEAARSELNHRGPDDSDCFVDHANKIGLAHTRLAILDPAPTGHQPMICKEGEVVLVFNGEIFNYRELRQELNITKQKSRDKDAIRWRGNSDTEVLLELYLDAKKRKKDFGQVLRDLNGIFAFAIWDSQAKQLLVARDAVGVKPLYFAAQPDRFVFGSEIKAMLPLMSGEPKIDAIALQRYVTYLWCPGERTPDQRIKKLEPGQFLLVQKGKIVERNTWYRLPVFNSPVQIAQDICSVTRQTVRVLRQAVHRQMVSDVPLGTFLSGGLDSSVVATFAREIDPNIKCFTIDTGCINQEGFENDLPFARKVAGHLRVQLEIISVTPHDLATGVEDMVYQLDEPLADPAPLHVRFICKLARKHGIKVLLSGAGGDDIFSGYRRHRALKALQYFNRLPIAARKTLSKLSSCFPQNIPTIRRMSKFLSAGSSCKDLQLVQLFLWIGEKELACLFTDSFRAALGDSLAEQPMLDFLNGIPNDASELDRLLGLEQRFFLADHNLLYTDKMSMAEGVEVRVPFLDIDLIEFAARIPDSMKQNGPEGKWILKKAMEPYLPREVIYRPKSGFGVPLRRWLKVELRDWLADTLSAARLKNRGFFDPSAVERLIRDNATGRVDAAYILFSLACIEIWCRTFLDKSWKPKCSLSGAPQSRFLNKPS